MGISKQQKLDQIAAARGPIENEHYAAVLDLETSEAGGDPKELVAPKKRRVADIERKLEHLDKQKAAVQKEKDPE